MEDLKNNRVCHDFFGEMTVIAENHLVTIAVTKVQIKNSIN